MEASASDDQLVRGFLATRDPHSFRALVERHRAKVFRLCASVLGPGHSAEAEDLAQDVFVQVFRRLHTFERQAAFSTWLYRIAYNAAVDRRRALRARGAYAAPAPAREVRDRGDDPFAATARGEHDALLHECLRDLPDLYRTAVHMHYWVGASVEEIGLALGAPPNTVKSYLHRARARLQALLERRGLGNE